jgi:hypothetical protein
VSLLTVKEAAKRARRTVRTIERWIADPQHPLSVIWISNVRYVREDLLLAELRRRRETDPTSKAQIGAETRNAKRVTRNLQRTHREHIERLIERGHQPF